MSLTPIHDIQGTDLLSPLGGQRVTTRGVVTGHTRKGFFIQDPDESADAGCSVGVFVFSRRRKPPVGALVQVDGEVLDYIPGENERPTTQLEGRDIRVVDEIGPEIAPTFLTADAVTRPSAELAQYLNSLEGMLVGIQAGATFVAPSNAFGDYVLAPVGVQGVRTAHGGVLIDRDRPERWLPGFRITDYRKAPAVNVGAELRRDVVGPLNFRASSYQIAARGPLEVKPAAVKIETTRLRRTATGMTVLTLNGFNLDEQLEDAGRVHDPRRDVDDDFADGRFAMLARAVVEQAGAPDVVALQEIQDDDGAEISNVVSAGQTYARLVRAIRRLGGPAYRWADIPPEVGADGGQPGGNIRNAYLYNPERVELVPGTLRRIGDDIPAYEGSRKPLTARFRLKPAGGELTLINVHLASKRHQHGLFAPESPGHDPREPVRIRQAELIREETLGLARDGHDYYVTGDFNDFEFSPTLKALLGEESVNLVETVAQEQRYDYNHRGISQVLMHGIVSKAHVARDGADYEILHGNELIGTKPGEMGERPTDHAYVIARLRLGT